MPMSAGQGAVWIAVGLDTALSRDELERFKKGFSEFQQNLIFGVGGGVKGIVGAALSAITAETSGQYFQGAQAVGGYYGRQIIPESIRSGAEPAIAQQQAREDVIAAAGPYGHLLSRSQILSMWAPRYRLIENEQKSVEHINRILDEAISKNPNRIQRFFGAESVPVEQQIQEARAAEDKLLPVLERIAVAVEEVQRVTVQNGAFVPVGR